VFPKLPVQYQLKNKSKSMKLSLASLSDEHLPCDWCGCLWREKSAPVAETGLPEKNEKLSRRVEAKTGVSMSESIKGIM
jgi:hypothetical protein